MGSMITYTRPDGQSATAYLVQPQAGHWHLQLW